MFPFGNVIGCPEITILTFSISNAYPSRIIIVFLMEKEKGTEHNIVDINLLIKRRI
jgi:hypothetical protein